MRSSLMWLGIFMMVAATCFFLSRRALASGGSCQESYTSGDIVGMNIDRNTDPEVAAALEKLTKSAQWLACVPAIQLEKLATSQAGTGVATVKAYTIVEALKKQKNSVLVYIRRLGVSPAFKSGLIQYAEYVLSAVTDMVDQFTNSDGFVDLNQVAKSLSELRGGYCKLDRNFGLGNSFLPATK